jgi:hypothetical protein
VTHIKIGVFGALVAIAAAGCNKEEDTSGGVSMEAAPAELAKAICPKAYTCCVQSQLMGNDQAGTDEASCEAKTTTGFRNNLNGLKHSIDKKRSRYLGDKMEACITFIRSATCERLNRTNHFSGLECEPWIEPLVAVGGTCGNDYECVASFCAKAEKAAEGTCKPWPAAGESCATVSCGKGLVCDENKTCKAALPEGAACTTPFECGSGNCSAPFGGAPKSCAPPTADKCFYSSACAYGRSGRPPAALLFLAALAIGAIMRRKKKDAAGAPPI